MTEEKTENMIYGKAIWEWGIEYPDSETMVIIVDFRAMFKDPNRTDINMDEFLRDFLGQELQRLKEVLWPFAYSKGWEDFTVTVVTVPAPTTSLFFDTQKVVMKRVTPKKYDLDPFYLQLRKKYIARDPHSLTPLKHLQNVII